jgi:hypothetical protein
MMPQHDHKLIQKHIINLQYYDINLLHIVTNGRLKEGLRSLNEIFGILSENISNSDTNAAITTLCGQLHPY